MADLNAIVVFAKVAQEGSFTRAAHALGLPKSTVSERISSLEERLGVRLLERTTRKLTLTSAGAAFYERAARIAADVEEAEASLSDSQKAPHGVLKVASPLLFAHAFLGDFIAEFLRDHPGIDVVLTVGDRRVNPVEDGFDLAITSFGAPDSGVRVRPLGTARRVAVASPTYVSARGAPAHPAELARHSCIVSGLERRTVWDFEIGGKSEAVPISGRYVVNSLQLAMSASLAGVGIAVLPSFFVAEAIRAGKLVPVLSDYSSGQTELNLVCANDARLPARVRIFADALVERFTRLPRWGMRSDGTGIEFADE